MKRQCLTLISLIFVSLSQLAPAGATQDNTLRYGESVRPDTLDPYTSRESSSLRLSELIFNGLIRINEKQEIEPDLAESWEISQDRKTFTFYLRKNVYWHNKNPRKYPFTAKDVIFTEQLISHPKTDSDKKYIFENFNDLKALDDYTLQVTLKERAIASLALFQFKILPAHVLAKFKFLSKRNPFSNKPIGTGPYQYLRSNHNRDITLEANPAYYAGAPKIKHIITKPFADTNIMIQALTFNALDLIVNVNPRHYAELQANPDFKLISYNTLSYSFFAYNERNPHLANQKVRKAISHAIDRQQMLQAFFNGQGSVISGPFAPGSWAYNLDIPPDQYDPNIS
ncbi:MAG TPA: hypothetical protein ENK06_14535, partial [Gammaproteobacteria bacterium]|nr:hypothetical protein [Gammaproteobacteria bacterium]